MATGNSSLSELYQSLSSDLDILATTLRSLPFEQATVTVIPPIEFDDQSEIVPQITLSRYVADYAVRAAIECYQDLYIKPFLSQKIVRRSPGVLRFAPSKIGSEASHMLISLVQRINTTKERIELHVTTNFTTRQQRFDALRSVCPGVMTKQLYRRIRLFDEECISSIRFTWLRKQLVAKLDREKLLRELETELVKAADTRRAALEILQKRVLAAPESTLRIRRDVKVQPAANIVSGSTTQIINSPMPLVVLQDEPVDIKVLGDYDASVTRRTRSDRAKSELLGYWSGSFIEFHPN